MGALRATVLPDCEVERFLRLGAGILDAAPGVPTLLVGALRGEVVALGRHQRAASAIATSPGLPVLRRLGGGKALRLGDGVLGVLLALPDAGALLGQPIAPDRVLNRYVRGLLAGLSRASEHPPRYFGRDFLSAHGRRLAVVSQEGAPSGVVLLEAYVALDRPLGLPGAIDRWPQHSDARAAGPADVTLVELGWAGPDPAALARAIVEGYARLHGCDVDLAPAPPVEGPLPGPPPLEDETGFAWSGRAEVPIGFVEALVRHERGLVLEARLRGDFIAPRFLIAEAEAALSGCPIDRGEIGRRITAALAHTGAVLIGGLAPDLLRDAVLAAPREPPPERPIMNDEEDDENDDELPDAVELPIDGILDLHAFAPGEIKELVRDYLDECLRRGIVEVRIVHGKGRGVLRRTVHALLERHPQVVSFRLADEAAGGWGATLVTLRPLAQGD